jgi:hypothetical protein
MESEGLQVNSASDQDADKRRGEEEAPKAADGNQKGRVIENAEGSHATLLGKGEQESKWRCKERRGDRGCFT